MLKSKSHNFPRSFLAYLHFGIPTLLICAMLLSQNATANDAKVDKFRDAIEVFELYCFKTSADYSRIEEMAAAEKMKKAPKELLTLVLGSSAAEGKGFLFNERSMLVISKPDACGVYFDGVRFSDVEAVIKKSYKLYSFYRDDVGLEVSEMFIPGGRGAVKEEINELGIISVTYPKPGFGDPGFSMSFLPPRTTKLVFK